MSIVRSLLISIGFVNDKKAINETNKAITGFKTRFALAATTATYAFKIINDFFSGIADATLETDDLARSMGYTLNQIIALQRGFQKFRINDTQASAILQTLHKDLTEFSQGYGRLRTLMREHGLEIPKNATPIELLDTILKYLQKIDDEVIRSQIANKFFPGLGIKISDVSVHMKEFKESVDESYEALQKTPDIKEELNEYKQGINSITNSLDSLFKTIVVKSAPAITFLSENIKLLVELLSSALSFDLQGVKNAFSGIGGQFKKFYGFIAEKTGLDVAGKRFKEYAENENTSPPPINSNVNWAEMFLPASWVNYVNNQVEINMPAGTTQEQTQYLGTQIERLISDSINATFQDIQYNNPVIE